jgi:hypothetical protein
MKLARLRKDISVSETLAKIDVAEARFEEIAEAQGTIADGIKDLTARLNQLEAFKNASGAHGWGKA